MPRDRRVAALLAMSVLITAVALALLASNAAAQTYPAKPIRVVLPFPPGGGTDALARIIAPKLNENLGPRAIIDRLHAETVKVLRLTEVRDLFNNVGYEVTGTSPEQLAEIIRVESAMWAKVIKSANIRAE